MAHEDDRLAVSEKLGYGFGDLASNLFWQMFSIFIAKYYTDVFLLGAATMGTMLLVTRLGDAIIDPVIGAIADRTKTRWGSFRPYLVWMALPMAGSAVLTFTVPEYSGNARVIYAYLTLSLMMVCYSAINIPYSALLGVLTPSSAERTSACSYRFVMAILPVFIIVNTALPMATYFGGDENSAPGWQITMIIYSTVAVLLYLATFALTRERVAPEARQKSSLASDLRDLMGNRPWLILCGVGIAALTYGNIRGTVSIYYFENVVPGGKAYFGPVMTTGAIAVILGVMATSPLARRFGKKRLYMVSMALTALSATAFYFVPADNLPLLWTVNTLVNLCAAPTAPLVWAMYADTADYSEWKAGRRATGLVFSAASFSQKFGWAIGGAGAGWLLAYFGYQPGIEQSAGTRDGIVMMMSLIPALMAAIAGAALWFYELDEPMVARMSSDLESRRAVAAAGTVQPTDAAPVAAISASLSGGSGQPIGLAFASDQGGIGERKVTPSAPGGVAMFRGAGPAGAGVEPAPLSSEQARELQGQVRALLQDRVHGLCFSPYLPGQSPGDPVSAAQIHERLQTIAPHTRWIRTFSCTDGHEETPRFAHALGLKTLVGAWLGKDAAINEREIEGLIAIGRAGHADIVAVGNEVLLRGDLNEDELLAALARVRAALPGIPVGYVDAYYLFERHPRIAAACDVLLTNCYPFWEACPREQALPYMQEMLRRTLAVAGGKRVIVSETGWPDRGSPFHAAVPSTEGAMRYFIDTQRWAQREGLEVFYFAAFDEAWKVGAEGDVGAYWGLWDDQAQPKYGAL